MPKLAGLLARIQARLAEVRAARAAEDAADLEYRVSRSTQLYNPPSKPERPFEADYPNGAATDESGRLLFDIDGRPLGRGVVVGRQEAGGSDTGLPASAYDAIAEGLTGKSAEILPAREFSSRGLLGEVVINRHTRQPELVRLSNQLTPEQLAKAFPHELGHVVDQAAGEIPVDGLSRELAQVYSTLNTGSERPTKLFGPKHAGYDKENQPRELVAEAVRAYMADPNYIKTVAPKTAARIREHVNSNPKLRDIIQFNTIAPAAVGLSALGMSSDAEAPTSNRLVELAAANDRLAQIGMTQPTGIAEAPRYPWLDSAANTIDNISRRSPLLDLIAPVDPHGAATFLRNFGQERPVLERLGDSLGVVVGQ